MLVHSLSCPFSLYLSLSMQQLISIVVTFASSNPYIKIILTYFKNTKNQTLTNLTRTLLGAGFISHAIKHING